MYKLDQQELLKLRISMPTVKALANLQDSSESGSELANLLAAEIHSLATKLQAFKHEFSVKYAEIDSLVASFRRIDVGKIQRQVDDLYLLVSAKPRSNELSLQQQIDEIRKQIG